MSDQFDPDQLHVEYNRYDGFVSIAYNNIWIPRCNQTEVRGSRMFFNIDNEFFIKVCNGEYGISQCKTETYKYAQIEAKDRRYFTELLYACDFKGKYHWTVWRYVQLRKCSTEGELFEACLNKVNQLALKYGIFDLSGCWNWNWWIHNNEPLIVDIGCE